MLGLAGMLIVVSVIAGWIAIGHSLMRHNGGSPAPKSRWRRRATWLLTPLTRRLSCSAVIGLVGDGLGSTSDALVGDPSGQQQRSRPARQGVVHQPRRRLVIEPRGRRGHHRRCRSRPRRGSGRGRRSGAGARHNGRLVEGDSRATRPVHRRGQVERVAHRPTGVAVAVGDDGRRCARCCWCWC